MQMLTIAGTIGRDAEVRHTQGGEPVANFSVAVDNGKDSNGNRRDATWFDAALWGKRATGLAPYLLKGGKVTITGRPTAREHNGKSDYDGDSLRTVQGKTGKALFLPVTQHLKAALDTAPKTGLSILTKRDGTPMDYNHMARVMLTERKRLELTAYDQHALRYRGVMELAWHGCTDDEIAAYSGHTSRDMIAKYAGEARQVMRARQAREKRR